ncbi:MAG TPA: 16S rRNA (guanine(966)-N(2))-methyltransferase RsmD [Ruminiclostridium sp.]|jgi:16S rRNA (guanine(966)-N(2))-methyltransferase RsmD|nr:16S rRNA (guanine(966)-N(2))-methyltransferase RsmD [Ruminiclostridium sp.]
MLRIIGGTARGIRIQTPDTIKTRPTLDRVKESVFNILMPYIGDTVVLDLFSGSGNLGIEALSRGAKYAVFVDESKICRRVIAENLKKTKFLEQSFILTMDVFRALKFLKEKGEKFDIIFMDPPYNMNFLSKTLQMIDDFGIINEDGIIACEHDEVEMSPEQVGGLSKVRTKAYGDTMFSFYVESGQG